MADFDLSIDGTEEIRKTLVDLVSADSLEGAGNRSGLLVVNRMAKYPQKPAGSTYDRTGTLGKRWTYRLRGSGRELEIRVGNNTVYGPWVQSEQFQARVHKGHWQTDEQVLNQEDDRIRGFFEDAIVEVIR